DEVLRRRPIQILHGDEGFATLLAKVVNRTDVRMVERRGGLGFPAKPLERLLVLRHVVRQEFERYVTVQPRVLCLIHHTHPASTQLVDDTVMRDSPTDHEIRLSSVVERPNCMLRRESGRGAARSFNLEK